MSSVLLPGAKLSRYEIRSQLGKGGMGDVYLARDRNVNRDVALKVLPADFASDRERLQRFKQEAQAAASLNHPNIAHVYEIGEFEGTHFIAMEFIDGQTLRDCIYVERAALTELLRYLQHVAEALAKAHAAGIVHRDLKPENIMINRDGYAKLLDFGLAKLVEQAKSWGGSSSSDSDVATVLEHLSRSGVILGTVGYMSPEQAQGFTDKIDQRSDIFSFGCILFEAVTGRKAFQGVDAIDSLNQIIREPAPSVSSIRPGLPPELQKIVRRCLEKKPDDRYQSIKDVAIELKDLHDELLAAGYSQAPLTTYSAALAGAYETQSGGAASSLPARTESVTRASSAEYLVSEMKQHKKTSFVVAALVLLGILGGIFGIRAYLLPQLGSCDELDRSPAFCKLE